MTGKAATVGRSTGVTLVAASLLLGQPASAGEPYFKIRVVDEQTRRPVPLVQLETVNSVAYWTDSNGLVAFHEPGLMNRRVFFHVRSHGYEFRKDGFGYGGVVLRPTAGGSAEIHVTRLNVAERLYRITGQGIYRDSVLLGEPVPIRQPVLNAQVAGQDSVLAVPYRGKIYWFWGDTGRPRYPLGHFRTAGATSERPGDGGLDPAVGVDLTYFVDKEGFSRPMCPLPDRKKGLVWMDGITTAPDSDGRARLVGRYALMEGLGKMLEHGLAVYDDAAEAFRKALAFELKEPWRHPQGHPARVEHDGTPFLLFPRPFPVVRVKATLGSLRDSAKYEAFTCLAPGSRFGAEAKVERDASGKPVWAWKPDTDPVGQQEERALTKAGALGRHETRFQLRDVETGKRVTLHGGSFHWNAFRRKWIMIGCERGGSTSLLGEIWYAEADAPVGPWGLARKIVTHAKYSFYNPTQHPFFDQEGGRLIYFEGTYTSMFSGSPAPTPRYNYNQIMYRLDLADQRLRLAR